MESTNIYQKDIWSQPEWYQALTLEERRAESVEWLACTPLERKRAEQRLHEWKTQKPFDQETFFASRLEKSDLSEEMLLALLAESSQSLQVRNESPPEWFVWLRSILEKPQGQVDITFTTQGQNQLLATCLPALRPLIIYGYDCLQAGITALVQKYERLPFDSTAIIRTFLPHLANRLLPQISKTCILEMHVARLEGRLQGQTPDERFERFMHLLGKPDQLSLLLVEYPALARLVVTTIKQWSNYTLEFLDHLCADWSILCATFWSECDPGLLIKVDGGMGDTHREGRSVLLLTFSEGHSLLYKPKSLAVDIHFQELLTWLNEQGATPPLRTLQLIDKGNYGWSEFVEEVSCTEEEEIARFYERQGSCLALFYAINATDIHAENLIASGEHPMFIDLEALFHPLVQHIDATRPDALAAQTISHSVLRVGLLPHRVWSNAQNAGVDYSGLGGPEGQMTPYTVPRWREEGTETMRLIRTQIELPTSCNRPKLQGKDVRFLDYSEHIVRGFQRMYRLLMRKRADLVQEILPRFAHDEIRYIFRQTRTYAALLMESFHPDLLRDGLERERFFDHLWAGTVFRSDLPCAIQAEQKALFRGDIPMFITYPASKAIFSEDGKPLPDLSCQETSLDAVFQRLQSLSEDDLKKQTWIVEASLATFLMETGHISGKVSPLIPTPASSSQTLSLEERALQGARSVGERLSTLALCNDYGASWVGLAIGREGAWDLVPTDETLYNGASGIILFLAYLGALLDEPEVTALARQALKVVDFRVEQQISYGLDMPIGAFEGLGSYVYLLSHLAPLWNDPQLLQKAQGAVEYLEALIKRDEHLDIVSGTAGCLMSLLSLYHVSPDQRILETALLCGERLLSTAQSMTEGIGWKLPNQDTPLTGFSHGAAGIALSLFKLAALSDDQRFRDAALDALIYERSLFSPRWQNWPDLRTYPAIARPDQTQSEDESDEWKVTWCHGAPGVALGRLGTLPYYDHSSLREEIAIALKTTITQGFGGNHSLCHGDLGNLEVLLVAQQMFDDPSYSEQCLQQAAMILDSIDDFGWLTGVPRGVETPGLMMGLAGIGYELLRLARPNKVPSILLLEAPYHIL